MKDYDLVHFYSSSEIFDKAAEVFANEKETLEKIISNSDVDIQHVGGCSIPGALGKFDVDIQIRTNQESFLNVVEQVKKNLHIKHPSLWTDNFAIFRNDPNSPLHIDYIVTIINTAKDDFYRVRDYLISHPDKLQEYNELKMRFEGKPYHEYRTAKQEFLGGNGKVNFLDYYPD